MFQQVVDLREDGKVIHEYLLTLTDEQWPQVTPFKDLTCNEVVQHLHGSDKAAVYSLKDPDGFRENLVEAGTYTNPKGGTLKGQELVALWWEYFNEMCDLMGELEPSARVPWFGPDMGIRMFTTARQMETWAHAQDIYDLFDVVRENTDRIKNIVTIGVKTYGWTYVNRGMEVPADIPYIKLTSPSGEIWEYNDPNTNNYIEGSAVEFAHVATQGRNIGDVHLKVVGDVATEWMSFAQCFAGPAKDPPPVGKRNCKGYLEA
jgi:uncharacterized protein (TIGR03084 family)